MNFVVEKEVTNIKRENNYARKRKPNQINNFLSMRNEMDPVEVEKLKKG